MSSQPQPDLNHSSLYSEGDIHIGKGDNGHEGPYYSELSSPQPHMRAEYINKRIDSPPPHIPDSPPPHMLPHYIEQRRRPSPPPPPPNRIIQQNYNDCNINYNINYNISAANHSAPSVVSPQSAKTELNPQYNHRQHASNHLNDEMKSVTSSFFCTTSYHPEMYDANPPMPYVPSTASYEEKEYDKATSYHPQSTGEEKDYGYYERTSYHPSGDDGDDEEKKIIDNGNEYNESRGGDSDADSMETQSYMNDELGSTHNQNGVHVSMESLKLKLNPNRWWVHTPRSICKIRHKLIEEINIVQKKWGKKSYTYQMLMDRLDKATTIAEPIRSQKEQLDEQLDEQLEHINGISDNNNITGALEQAEHSLSNNNNNYNNMHDTNESKEDTNESKEEKDKSYNYNEQRPHNSPDLPPAPINQSRYPIQSRTSYQSKSYYAGQRYETFSRNYYYQNKSNFISYRVGSKPYKGIVSSKANNEHAYKPGYLSEQIKIKTNYGENMTTHSLINGLHSFAILQCTKWYEQEKPFESPIFGEGFFKEYTTNRELHYQVIHLVHRAAQYRQTIQLCAKYNAMEIYYDMLKIVEKRARQSIPPGDASIAPRMTPTGDQHWPVYYDLK